MQKRAAIRREYERRFHRVVSYIDRHLDGSISVKELAQEAAFSEFHFQRVFAAHQGERIGQYIARRRLEMAAIRLLSQPKLAILNVALDVGFGSSEAFSRAFKDRFGSAPRAWRAAEQQRRVRLQNSSLDQETSESIGYGRSSLATAKAPPLVVSLIRQPPIKVHYLRLHGPFGPPIARFWGDAVVPWMKRNNLMVRRRFGVCHDDPSFTEDEQCRYDGCVEARLADSLEEGGYCTELPGGWYAVTRFSGRPEEIVTVWDRLLRDWMPASGFQVDARPFMERYEPEHRRDEENGVFECDILIPVTNLI